MRLYHEIQLLCIYPTQLPTPSNKKNYFSIGNRDRCHSTLTSVWLLEENTDLEKINQQEMWLCILCQTCAYSFVKHGLQHKHISEKKGTLTRTVSCQPFLTHKAGASASDLPALPELVPRGSITNLVYHPVLDSLRRQLPSLPSYPTPILPHPLRDNIFLTPWIQADLVTYSEHRMWLKGWCVSSRPGSFIFERQHT